MEFRVFDEDTQVRVPNPRTHQRLRGFVEAMDRLREEPGDDDEFLLDRADRLLSGPLGVSVGSLSRRVRRAGRSFRSAQCPWAHDSPPTPSITSRSCATPSSSSSTCRAPRRRGPDGIRRRLHMLRSTSTRRSGRPSRRPTTTGSTDGPREAIDRVREDRTGARRRCLSRGGRLRRRRQVGRLTARRCRWASSPTPWRPCSQAQRGPGPASSRPQARHGAEDAGRRAGRRFSLT